MNPGRDAVAFEAGPKTRGVETDLSPTWTLLIYTIPSQPTRLRAAIWRELKKLGAVYLRDGVCVLPAGEASTAAFAAVAARVGELGGEATVVEEARLPAMRTAALVEQFRAARAEEYAEVARETEGFLAHVEREREHRVFTFAEVEELEADLGKLQRWAAQIRARDYFDAKEAATLDDLLARGEAALTAFADDAYDHDAARG
jgi:hypothetical protein